MKNKYANILAEISNEPRKQNESILIIDGLNTFLRNFTVINHINRAGEHIGGLTGTLKSIGYAIKLINPTKVIIVFDGIGGASAKRNLYPEYKANRYKNGATNFDIFTSKEEEDESVKNQMARLIQYLQCLPVSIASIDGIEADDVIGKLVVDYENNSETKEITIMSADKDFLQLISSKTQVYSPSKKKIYKPKDVKEEYGVDCINFINYKVLLGDQSDNIPGIKGLGPIKLIKLFPELTDIHKFTLDNIIEKSAELINENKLYSSIVERRHQLEINNKLMNLKEILISDENVMLINQMVRSNQLESVTFLQMYYKDNLEESIPNVNQWLSQIFGSLSYFN